MTAPGRISMVALGPRPGSCVACAQRPAAGQPICGTCRRSLAHVCYGKARVSEGKAKEIAARPATEPQVPYPCPVCRYWHTGRDSALGRMVYADAVLIALRLYRHEPGWLPVLALAWSPERSSRTDWRAKISRAPERGHEWHVHPIKIDSDPHPEVRT